MNNVQSLPVIGGVEIPAVNPRLFIGGAWRDASDGGTFEVLAPASEEHLADVASATEADINAAVAAARAQFDGGEWSRMAPEERGRLLYKLADLVERDVDILATIEAADVGRPIFESKMVDIPVVADVFRHFAGWADKIEGRWITPKRLFDMERQAYTLRQPLGVIGAITPWNLPTLIASWKLAPALAAGNTIVLKPAEDASLSLLHLASLFDEAGFPPGTVNIVPGLGKDAGAALVRHPGIDKISFTGSTEIGREIGIEAARTFKRVTLELGGKSPQIVLGDVDVDAIVPGLAIGFMANQGQTCGAGSRILVAREKYDDVVAGLAEAARNVRLGGPFDPHTQMGALVNAKQRDRVLGYISRGQEEGSELVAGGGRPDGPGFFVQPTVFAGGGHNISIAQEEIFGPVGLVLPFDDVDEAIRLANDTQYGLAAYVWTRDISRAHQISAKVRAGGVYINGGGAPDARLPWGGTKASGIGRELGYAGIEAHTEEKTVTITF